MKRLFVFLVQCAIVVASVGQDVCLLDLLQRHSTTPVDQGGEWLLDDWNGQPVDGLLTNAYFMGTDNPCIDIDRFGCGITRLVYRGEKPNCRKANGDPCYNQTVMPLYLNCPIDTNRCLIECAIPEPVIVCEGDFFTLEAAGGVSYEWGFPDGSTSTDQVILLGPAYGDVGGVYTLLVTDSEGCESLTAQEIIIYNQRLDMDIEMTLPLLSSQALRGAARRNGNHAFTLSAAESCSDGVSNGDIISVRVKAENNVVGRFDWQVGNNIQSATYDSIGDFSTQISPYLSSLVLDASDLMSASGQSFNFQKANWAEGTGRYYTDGQMVNGQWVSAATSLTWEFIMPDGTIESFEMPRYLDVFAATSTVRSASPQIAGNYEYNNNGKCYDNWIPDTIKYFPYGTGYRTFGSGITGGGNYVYVVPPTASGTISYKGNIFNITTNANITEPCVNNTASLSSSGFWTVVNRTSISWSANTFIYPDTLYTTWPNGMEATFRNELTIDAFHADISSFAHEQYALTNEYQPNNGFRYTFIPLEIGSLATLEVDNGYNTQAYSSWPFGNWPPTGDLIIMETPQLAVGDRRTFTLYYENTAGRKLDIQYEYELNYAF